MTTQNTIAEICELGVVVMSGIIWYDCVLYCIPLSSILYLGLFGRLQGPAFSEIVELLQYIYQVNVTKRYAELLGVSSLNTNLCRAVSCRTFRD